MLGLGYIARVLGLVLAWVLVCTATSWAAPPDPWGDLTAPEAEARLSQEILPSWAAREASASARAQALEQVLAGERPLQVAVPQLGALALNELAVIEGRLRALDGAAERRIGERARLAAAVGAARPHVGLVQPAWTLMAEAEDRADALERRLLLALKGWLREHPWARAEGKAALLDPLRARVVEARAHLQDPDGGERLALAAIADQEIARTEQLVLRLRDVAVSGVAPLPEPEAAPPSDAAFEQRYGAALRLAMLADVVDEGAEIEAALAPAAAGLEEGSDQGGAEPRAALRRWEQALEHAPAALRGAILRRVELAREQLDEERSLADEARSTVAEAEEARQDPNVAAAFTARLIEARLPAEKRLQERTEASKARRESLQASYEEARSRLESAREVLLAAVEVGRSVDKSRIDGRYRELPALLVELREQARALDDHLGTVQRDNVEISRRIEAERARIRDERQALVGVTHTEVRERRAEALRRWGEVLDREEAFARSWVAELQEARDRILALIPEVASTRSELSRWSTSKARAEDRSGMLIELLDELSMVRPTYAATVRARWHKLREDPFQLLDLTVISTFVFGSFSLLLGAILWIIARRYSDVIVAFLLNYLGGLPQLSPPELHRLKPMLRRSVRTLVDVLGALLLLRFVPSDLPELSVLLLLLFEVQLLRFVQAVYDLVIARLPDRRPALAHLSEAAWRLGRRTVVVLALWVAIRRVLLAFAQDLLAGFATENLVRLSAGWTLVALLVVCAYAWAPHLRGRAGREVQEGWVRRWLAEPPPTVLLNGPQAVAALALITYFSVRRLVYLLARRSAGARWLSALDVIRFGRQSSAENQVERAPLSEPLKHAILRVAAHEVYVDRPKARAAMVKEIQDWHRDDQQGLIALLGDAGEGLDTAIERWSPEWAELGFPLIRVEVDRRLTSKVDALTWLAEQFDLPEIPEDVDQAAELLEEHLEPGLILVDRLNHAFLRSVGGFDAIRTLLEVFHADGFKRCWILAFYRPSWRYLERLGASVNVHLVRAVIDLVPLTAPQLRELSETVADKVGLELDFTDLAQRGALAGSLDQEREHAIEAYYRLLLGASAGNPSVAVGLWLSCLDAVEEGKVRVFVPDTLRGSALPELHDDHLFVLAALRTHRKLTEAELVEVLNVAHIQVRALVRQMVAMGLLARDRTFIEIRRLKLPAVTLLLRRRHFLHWS